MKKEEKKKKNLKYKQYLKSKKKYMRLKFRNK